jgi:hypothetical protein
MKVCASDNNHCRSVATKLGQVNAVCETTDWMVCYRSTHVMSGVADVFCFGDMATCTGMQADFAKDPNRSGTSDCFVMRYAP